MKRFLISFMVTGVLLMGVAAAVAKQPHLEKLAIETKVANASFHVEIADTPEKMQRGLMFRKHLAAGHGMLFEIGEPVVISFWMKNTLIPLDMIFIGADGTIKKIYENAQPEVLTPISSGVSVKAVLEINGGAAKAMGIVVGSKVIHSYFLAASH